jgi:anti-sigma B factor antagonist
MSQPEFQASFFDLHPAGDVFVATISCKQLTEEENLEQMSQELLSLIDVFNCRKLVVSLERVTFVTSAALGRLITLHRRLHRKEGRMILAAANGGVADVLRLSRLQDYFSMAADVQSGVTQLQAT